MSLPEFEKVLIGGEWVPAGRGTYEITNPATGGLAGRASHASTEQVEAAIHSA